jgi:hypothetical protein
MPGKPFSFRYVFLIFLARGGLQEDLCCHCIKVCCWKSAIHGWWCNRSSGGGGKDKDVGWDTIMGV